MKRVLAAAGSALLLLSACATSSENVSAAYVSPMQYSSYTCPQIDGELMRVSSRVREVSGAQDRKARNDKIATGVGVVLFWPALFFLASGDKKEELSRLKGEYDALSAAANQKQCAVAQQLNRSR